MRLIDGDALIEKFNEKADMAECLVDARTAERFATFCALADAVEEMPTADAVVVTRCKDCTKFEQKGKYYNGRPFGYCYHWDYEEGSSPNEVDGDDFCSYGERRDKP